MKPVKRAIKVITFSIPDFRENRVAWAWVHINMLTSDFFGCVLHRVQRIGYNGNFVYSWKLINDKGGN